MNETMVTVVGNIAGDVTSRRVGEAEHKLVSFRVASSERRWDKASESWVDGDRFSALVNCWRRLAEGAVVSLVKGDPVIVTGRLAVREYEVEGARRFSTEITATSVGPDLSRCHAEISRRRFGVVEGTGAVGEDRESKDEAMTADVATGPVADVSSLQVVSVEPAVDGALEGRGGPAPGGAVGGSDAAVDPAGSPQEPQASPVSSSGGRRRPTGLSASA